MGQSKSKATATIPNNAHANLMAGNFTAAVKQLESFDNTMLLMNMEDSTTEDYELEYLAYENASGVSLPVQQLFAEQMNPSFVDEEALQDLASKFANNDAWLKNSAKTKRTQLWSKIAADQTSGKWPTTAGIFLESMEPTFVGKGDTMPPRLFVKDRTKFIHSVGATGKVKFVSNGKHSYTGLFEGSTQGIVRFSSAAQPSKDQVLAPGLGLKMLRDGVDSGNLVAMFGVNGQPEWNFFQHDFTTFIGSAKGAALTTLGCKFATATKHIQNVGMSDIATYKENGQKVSSPKHPYGLRFATKPAVKGVFNKINGGKSFAGYNEYLETLKAVPANSALYDIYAIDTPGGKQTLIGTLVLEGKLITSKFGDESLFFRHQKMDDDIKSRPELDAKTPKFKCPIPLNLLPF